MSVQKFNEKIKRACRNTHTYKNRKRNQQEKNNTIFWPVFSKIISLNAHTRVFSFLFWSVAVSSFSNRSLSVFLLSCLCLCGAAPKASFFGCATFNCILTGAQNGGLECSVCVCVCCTVALLLVDALPLMITR